jgi:hypothetical protein
MLQKHAAKTCGKNMRQKHAAKTCCKNMLQKHAALFAVKNFHLSSIQLEYLITRIKGDFIKSLQVALSNSVVLLGEKHA